MSAPGRIARAAPAPAAGGFFSPSSRSLILWIASVALALLALLAIFRAPAKIFWIPAVVVTEAGVFLALAALLICALSNRHSVEGLWTFRASAFAAVLLLTPLARAWRVAERLPVGLASAFGAVVLPEAGAPARAVPLRVRDLFRGVRSPPVRETSRVYSTAGSRPLPMDIYGPAGGSALRPAVLVIHGGSWASGSRKELSELNRYLAARGYLVGAIDYRLAPAFHFPAQVEDVFAAIAYLKSHAADLGWDADAGLVLLGRSAGGEIALAAAYAHPRDPAIRGVIAFYAPSDLALAYAKPGNPLVINSRKIIETYLGGPPPSIPAVYAAASPIGLVDRASAPTLLVHGGRDELVGVIHSERLARKLAENGRPYFFLDLPWATHGCDAFFRGPSGQLSTYVVERFLAAVLPVKK